VQKHYPLLNVSHTDVYQVDHMIERGFKRHFVEICNGTVVCSSCNSNKRYNSAIRKAIETIRIKTEGADIINRMFDERAAGGAFIDWRHIGWLEDKIKVLEQIRDMFKEGII